jgi:hypothetical protein
VRDGKQAVDYATRACALTAWKNSEFLATRAAAHAESGQFDKAMEVGSKALERAQEEVKQELRSRMALFKDGKPYRAR